MGMAVAFILSLYLSTLVKARALLATKISFINQIANLCQKIPGADVVKVAEAVGLITE